MRISVMSVGLVFLFFAALPLLAGETAGTIAPVPAPMTAAEKKALVEHLERTSAKFHKSVEGLTAAQWSFKAAPDRWSIAECSEHIAAAEAFIRNWFAAAMNTPATPEVLALARKDEQLEKTILDRSKKFKAPEPLIPTQKFKTAEEALAAFDAERKNTIEFVNSGGDLRMFAMDHPAAGPLDVYGWVTMLSAHTERHTLQIEEVKADANYPR